MYANAVPSPAPSSLPVQRRVVTSAASSAELFARANAAHIANLYRQAPTVGDEATTLHNAGADVRQTAITTNATHRNGSGMILHGTLVDLRCYGTDRRNYGADHVAPDDTILHACGRQSAVSGSPIGLLVDALPGSRTYVLLVPSTPLAAYVGHVVRVHGRPAGPDVGAGAALLVDRLEIRQSNGSFVAV